MLRLDRGILRIGGGGRGITRSSRVMTERGERRVMAERGEYRVMTGREENVWERKVDNDDKRKKPLKAVRETSRITEI